MESKLSIATLIYRYKVMQQEWPQQNSRKSWSTTIINNTCEIMKLNKTWPILRKFITWKQVLMNKELIRVKRDFYLETFTPWIKARDTSLPQVGVNWETESKLSGSKNSHASKRNIWNRVLNLFHMGQLIWIKRKSTENVIYSETSISMAGAIWRQVFLLMTW